MRGSREASTRSTTAVSPGGRADDHARARRVLPAGERRLAGLGDCAHSTVARALGGPPLIAAAAAAVALACAFVEAIDDGGALSLEAAALDRRDAGRRARGAPRCDRLPRRRRGVPRSLRRVGGARAARLALARATGQGALLPMLTQASSTGLAVQGRLVEAAEVLDGAIEGARLAGNDQTLAWDLLNRAFVVGPARRARDGVAAAEESVELHA